MLLYYRTCYDETTVFHAPNVHCNNVNNTNFPSDDAPANFNGLYFPVYFLHWVLHLCDALKARTRNMNMLKYSYCKKESLFCWQNYKCDVKWSPFKLISIISKSNTVKKFKIRHASYCTPKSVPRKRMLFIWNFLW